MVADQLRWVDVGELTVVTAGPSTPHLRCCAQDDISGDGGWSINEACAELFLAEQAGRVDGLGAAGGDEGCEDSQ